MNIGTAVFNGKEYELNEDGKALLAADFVECVASAKWNVDKFFNGLSSDCDPETLRDHLDSAKRSINALQNGVHIMLVAREMRK